MRYRDEICLNDLQSSIVNFDIRLKIVAIKELKVKIIIMIIIRAYYENVKGKSEHYLFC